MVLYVLDRLYNVVNCLSTDNNTLIAANLHEVLSGTDTLDFTVSVSYETSSTLLEENLVVVQLKAGDFRVFTIKEVIDSHGGTLEKQVYCEDTSIELADFYCLKEYKGTKTPLNTIISEILAGTRWRAAEVEAPSAAVEIDFETKDKSVLEVLSGLLALYQYQIKYSYSFTDNNITGRYVTLKKHIGRDTGKRFEYNKDITTVQRTVTATGIKTAAILVGGVPKGEEKSDNKEPKPVDITNFVWASEDGQCSTKAGQPFIEVAAATNLWGYKEGAKVYPRMTAIIDSNVTDLPTLCKKGYEYLKALLYPVINYEAKVTDIFALTGDVDYQAEQVYIGDIVTVLDKEITPEIITATNIVEKHTNLLNTAEVDIVLGKSQNTLANSSVTMPQLNTVVNGIYGSMGVITATHITTETLEAELAIIDELIVNLVKADTIITNSITALEGNFGKLSADVADIGTLVNGNLTSDNIHSMIITADKFTVENGFIKNAMIDNLSANKISAGTINSSQIDITSESGGIRLADNTIQFKDKDSVVRVQIGEDNNGDFTFMLVGSDGTGTLIDHEGIKEGALSEGIIKGDHIGQGAVGGTKIDWSDFVTEWNKDTNTNTIKASRVILDGTNQKLNVSFNQMDNKIDGVKSTVGTHTTELNVQAGKINTLISDTTIDKDGTTVKLKDEYSKLEQTVGSIKLTVSSHTSEISEVGKKVTANSTSINQLDNKISLKAEKTVVDGLASRVTTAEQKITPGAITNSVSEAISGGSSSLNTVSTVLDKNGFTVNNGAIKIKNKAGDTVFSGDSNGNLTVTGTVTGSTIRGSVIDGNTIRGSVIEGNTITGSTVMSTDIRASDIEGTTIRGSTITGSSVSAINNLNVSGTGGSWGQLNLTNQWNKNGTIYANDQRGINISSDYGVMITTNNVTSLTMHAGGANHFSGEVYRDGQLLLTCVDNTIYNLKKGNNEYMHVSCNDGARGVNWWNSDVKLKNNISALSPNSTFMDKVDTNKAAVNTLDNRIPAVDIIDKIEHFSFDMKDGATTGHTSCGYIAQQLQEVHGDFVFEVIQEPTITALAEDGTSISKPNPMYFKEDNVIRSPKASAILPYVTKAIQEQQAQLNKLQADNELLLNRLTALEKLITG